MMNIANINYKKTLKFEERTTLITTAVTLAKQLFNNGVYGATQYAIANTIIGACTDVDMTGLTPDEKWDFICTSPIMSKIEENIGSHTLKEIYKEFDMAFQYAISTNPDTKELILALTDLLRNFNNPQHRAADREILSAFINIAQGNKDENKSEKLSG